MIWTGIAVVLCNPMKFPLPVLGRPTERYRELSLLLHDFFSARHILAEAGAVYANIHPIYSRIVFRIGEKINLFTQQSFLRTNIHVAWNIYPDPAGVPP